MTLLLTAFAPGIIACLIIVILLIRKHFRNRKVLRGNLSIGFKPVFSDMHDNRFYNIICKCGNKFSIGTKEKTVVCEKCESFDKLSEVVKKFYDSLGK